VADDLSAHILDDALSRLIVEVGDNDATAVLDQHSRCCSAKTGPAAGNDKGSSPDLHGSAPTGLQQRFTRLNTSLKPIVLAVAATTREFYVASLLQTMTELLQYIGQFCHSDDKAADPGLDE
jgi:hypothetical protein